MRMDIEQLTDYCLQKPCAELTFPFGEDILVMKVGGKVFLLCRLDQVPFSFSVKTDPDWSLELREQFPQITGAYHMNKKHWNSVVCEGLKPELIRTLIDQSYELVFKSLPKAARTEIKGV